MLSPSIETILGLGITLADELPLNENRQIPDAFDRTRTAVWIKQLTRAESSSNPLLAHAHLTSQFLIPDGNA